MSFLAPFYLAQHTLVHVTPTSRLVQPDARTTGSRVWKVPPEIRLPDNQQDRDMIARELLIKCQMSERHPLMDLKRAYKKF